MWASTSPRLRGAAATVPPLPDPFSDIPPEVLTAEQVAERLGFSVIMIRKWTAEHTIPARFLGREYRYWWPQVVIALFHHGEENDGSSAEAPAGEAESPE
jgi:excisionase family DNA binding protein